MSQRAPCVSQRAQFRPKSRSQLRSSGRSLHRLRPCYLYRSNLPSDLGPGLKSLGIIRRGTLRGRPALMEFSLRSRLTLKAGRARLAL